MSMHFEVQVVIDEKVTKDDMEKLREILTAQGIDITFSDFVKTGPSESCTQIEGQISLVAAELEEEAHQRLVKAVKSVCPKSQVKTAWLCLEELPWEDYGPD